MHTGRILPTSERTENDHSFVRTLSAESSIFGGWGPRL